ncbi:MAG: hypothetical protein K8J31_32065 [Anaerolineae bacterium]|nr:hypothetical protein [Anaerolineae bacterium]
MSTEHRPPHPDAHRALDPVLARLTERDQQGVSAFYFELRLEEAGYLAGLEAAGVVPVAHDPNPFDPVKEGGSYQQWWAEHSQERGAYQQQVTSRQEALHYLHLGVVLASLAEDEPNRLHALFPVMGISRADLKARLHYEDATLEELDDTAMREIAGKLEEAYVELGFWEHLDIVAEEVLACKRRINTKE